MTDNEAISTAEHIGGIFPTVKPPMMKAIIQELINGNYNADKVITWANWRRAETSAFSLDEMRTEFINDQQKRNPQTDQRTAAWRRQRDQIDADYAKGKPERDRMKEFFETCSPDELNELKSELLRSCPAETQALVADKLVMESNFLRQLIWKMVNERATT